MKPEASSFFFLSPFGSVDFLKYCTIRTVANRDKTQPVGRYCLGIVCLLWSVSRVPHVDPTVDRLEARVRLPTSLEGNLVILHLEDLSNRPTHSRLLCVGLNGSRHFILSPAILFGTRC